MSRRRIERSIWSNGLRRRSPRISALDQQLDKTTSVTNRIFPKNKNTSFSTEGEKDYEESFGIKRKRQEEGTESQNRKHHSSTDDEEVVTEAKQKEILDTGRRLLPDKHLLELVLDVLQRRDTHEIFAQPVDPQEVEDYYEIVKEPMDFGTMRAKLHEGLYNTLEEFEHDAFLIPRNALLFNSTGSVYFRQSDITQARAIDDLAKKVFHVLKTNPKKLESEFSGTRRRASRRLQEGKDLKIYPRSKLATNVSSSDARNLFSSNKAQCNDNGPSDLSKSTKSNPFFSSKASYISTRASEFSSGGKYGKRFDFIEVDRRSTYKPPGPFDRGNTTISGAPQLLIHVNQGDISYSESLMKFAKDLGPVAQIIAKRKLQECTNLLQNPATPKALVDLNNIDDGTNSYTFYKNEINNSIISNIGGRDDAFKHHTDLYSSAKNVENLNLSGIRLENAEHPGFGIRFRKSFQRGFSNLRPTDGPNLLVPPVSPFSFNLSFLKSKLNHMEHHSVDQGRNSSILASDNGEWFVEKSMGGDLALRL